MMKRVLFLALALAVISCEKNPDGESSTPKDSTLSGFAQKGQFVKGSQVTAFAVGSDLVATGESFPANISDDLGAFSINGRTTAPFFELRAEGYYFNELEGSTSSNPLYLEAFVKSDDAKANINLMTTAIRPRVKKLIKEGKPYAEAINQTQNELLKSLGFTGTVGNFDDMDITGTSDADGMLLAFACMVQNGRSAAEVTTLIQEIASDLESKGELNAIVYEKVKSKAPSVNPYVVIQNLARYYQEKGLSVKDVPAFWKYLDSRYDAPFLIVDHITFTSVPNPGDVVSSPIKSSDAIQGGLDVLATINFTAEVDVEGATVNKEQIFGPAYHVSFTIPANTSAEERTVHVIFKDASGKVLDQREYTQGANIQYLMLLYSSTTKSDISIEDGSEDSLIQEGAEVSVNGKKYTIQRHEMLYGELGVAVPKEEKFVVCCPANTFEATEHVSRAKATLPASNNGEAVLPLYGALAPFEGNTFGNPAQVFMRACLVKFRFKVAEGYENDWSHVDFTPLAENEFLAGTASFVVNEEDKIYFPDLNPNTEFEADKQRTIRVNNTQALENYDCLTFPQTLSNGLKITVYGKNDEVLVTKELSGERKLSAGAMISFGAFKWTR